MRNAKEILKYLISLKCVNDPEKNIKPSTQCIKGIEEILENKDIDFIKLEDHGYYSFLYSFGTGKKTILLMAHFDVVPPGPSWTKNPFEPIEENNRIYGRGAIDDLSNVAVMIHISRDLEKIAERLDGKVIVAFTGDEETGGRHGAYVVREYLMSKGLFPNYLINGDGGGLVIINRRRSSFRITISAPAKKRRIRGMIFSRRYNLESRYRHAAYFLAGSDVHPLIKLAYEIDQEDLYVANLRGSFVKSNVLPEYVEADLVSKSEGSETREYEVDVSLTNLIKLLIPLTRISIDLEYPSQYGVTATPNIYRYDGTNHVIEIDVRAPIKKNIDSIKRYVANIVKEYMPSATFEIHGGVGYLDTPPNSRIVKRAIEVLEKLGLEPKVVERAGASDSRYFSPLGVEAIDFGPVGGNAHGPDEYVEIWSLDPLAKFYKELVVKLLSPDEE